MCRAAGHRPIGNRRYSRLEICATGPAAQPAPRIDSRPAGAMLAVMPKLSEAKPRPIGRSWMIRHYKLFAGIALLVLISGLVIPWGRSPSGPALAMKLLRVERVPDPTGMNGGPCQWAASFEVTNLTSTEVAFDWHEYEMAIQVTNAWANCSPPSFVTGLKPGDHWDFTLRVPQESQRFRFVTYYDRCPWRLRVYDFGIRHDAPTIFYKLVDWCDDKLPHQPTRAVLEVQLPPAKVQEPGQGN